MIYIDLILNLSLLVSFSIVSGFIDRHCKIARLNPNFALTLQGLLFGSAAVLGMMRPLNLGPGLIFDGRSVMVSLCTLFFGPLAGAIASILPALWRISLGGAGAITGVLVICSSFIIGVVAHFYFKPESKSLSLYNLYSFGFIVHIAMLAMMFTLPQGSGMGVVIKIGVPVMLFYPIATILSGKILSDIIDSRRQICELENSQGLLTSVINSIYDIVFFKDLNGIYLGCNKAFADHLGLSPEEIVGKNDYALYSKEQADGFRANDKKSLELMSPRQNEEWISYPDGRIKMIDTLKSPILDSKGKLIGVIGVSRDITESKKISELHEFLAQTSSRVRANSDFIDIHSDETKSFDSTEESSSSDTTDRSITIPFFNSLAKYLAKTLEMDFVCIDRLEGDGLSATTLAIWCDGHFQDNVSYSLKDTPCGEVVGKSVCCFPANVSQLFPNDKVLQELRAESYVGVTLFSHTGDPIGLIAVISRKPLQDRAIAESILKIVAGRASGELERLETQAELIESERNYRLLLNTMQESLSVIDIDGNFIFVNDKASKNIAGDNTVKMVGRNIKEFILTEQADYLIQQYRKVISNKETIEQEIMLSLSGKDKWFINTLQPIEFGSQKIESVLSMSLEITKHKRTESEKEQLQGQLLHAQKMESVGRLAGGVAHDFNNMLGVILGNVELAIDSAEIPYDIYNYLKDIQKAAQRSAELTHQLLAFARKQTISPVELDLNSTVESMLKMVKRLIGEDIDLVWMPGANIWSINMDPSQIDQILVNLCVNSRDAISDVGKITIETGVKIFDKAYCDSHYGFIQGEYSVLVVSDNGCGMDKDTIENIFEPFFTTKEMGRGTGLGLATVYGIVKQNNGFINVYSERNQGTTFRIYFPRYKKSGEDINQQNSMQSVEYGNETILLVEDETSILKLTKLMLEKQGYDVIAAQTPQEAIKLAKNHSGNIELLMTDVVMPEMNGRELAENIISIYPDIKKLFMSGYTANVIAHHGVLDAGVNFIQKPFSKRELSAKVREALSRI